MARNHNMDQEDKGRSWSDLPHGISKLIHTHISPYLISFVDDIKCKFYHPVLESTYYENFPMLKNCNSRISSSNFGWLLMNRGHCFLTFFNPFSFELIDVPPILYDDSFEMFYFSSPPTSSDCTVVAMKNFNAGCTEIGIIKRGEVEWTISQFDDGGAFMTSFCNAVFFNDRFYFMGDEFNIGILDVKTNEWKVCDNHIVPHRKYNLYRPIGMVEDNGGLLVVYETREHQQLHIMRFDLSKLMWENVNCLGDDKVFYVSEGACYLETVVAKDMGNKIYFPRFYESSCVFYCLATNKYYSCGGRYCNERTYKLVQPRFCTWIKFNHLKSIMKNSWPTVSDDVKDHEFYCLFKEWAILPGG